MWLKDRAARRARRLYRRSVGDEGVAVSLDTDVDSKTMLLTFGGMKSTVGIVAFEFVALTGSIPVKKMFVRDPRQSWYHRGMPSHGTTLESVGEVLQRILAEHEVERLVCVGSSAGGYAALLFGALLRADEVLAFGPQTTLDRQTLAAMDDHRWDYLLEPLYAKGALEERWIDLRSALPEVLAAPTRCRVYYDETVPGDRQHAEHLAGIERVRMYKFGRGGHSLTRALRDCGALERLLRDALHEPAIPADGPADPEQAPHGEPSREALRYRTYR
jgi:pimeloyl-ACP methyl ester carboxylesterase